MGQYLLLEKGDKPEKGFNVEMGGRWVLLFFLLYSSVQSVCVCVLGGGGRGSMVWYPFITFHFSDRQSFELAMQHFHPCSHSTLVLKTGFICAFLIHSGSRTKNVDCFI